MLKLIGRKLLNNPSGMIQARMVATSVQNKSVAFLGLGSMGKPMAANLVQNGFEVKGFDSNPSALSTCHEYGITPANSVKEVCQDADFVVTSLPKCEHIEQVMFDEEGVLESCKAGACIIDVSTISPMLAVKISKEAESRGLIYCDSPMAGGTPGAKAGTLVFMVGSKTEDDFNHAKIVLESMGKKFFYCGAPGNG